MGHKVSKGGDTNDVEVVNSDSDGDHSPGGSRRGAPGGSRSPDDVAVESELVQSKPSPKALERKASLTKSNSIETEVEKTESKAVKKINNFIEADEAEPSEDGAEKSGKTKGSSAKVAKSKRKLTRKSSKIAPSALPDVSESGQDDGNHSNMLTPVPLPKEDVPNGFITNTQLYNMLNDYDGTYIFDSAYLLLIDARTQQQYEEHHITSAYHKSALNDQTLVRALSDYDMVVLYSNNIGSPSQTEIAQNLKDKCKDKFYTLYSTYGVFYENYKCMCTEKVFYSNSDRRQNFVTYPSCVLEDQLYQGTGKQAKDPLTFDCLHITHVLNLGTEHPNSFADVAKYLNIRLEDEKGVDLKSSFSEIVQFITEALKGELKGEEGTGPGGRVLIHCNLGISRSSTATLAYLMQSQHWSLKDSASWLKERRSIMKPNSGFTKQLVKYEKELFGKNLSDISDLW